MVHHQAKHAEVICIESCSNRQFDNQPINLTYYLNSDRASSRMDKTIDLNFNDYVRETQDNLNSLHYIRFNKNEFTGLAELLQNNRTFQTNLANYNNSTKSTKSVTYIYGDILSRSYFKHCNKHEQEYREFVKYLNKIRSKKNLKLKTE